MILVALVLSSFAVLVRVQIVLVLMVVGARRVGVVRALLVLLSMGVVGRAAELAALRLLVASSCACCARVVVAPSVVLLAAVRAAAHGVLLIQIVWVRVRSAETSSGRLTTGYHLGLVAAAALQLRGGVGPLLPCLLASLQLVLGAAGVEVSVAVGLGHGLLILRVTVIVDVNCRCHCSLFDG